MEVETARVWIEVIWITTLIVVLLCFAALIAFMMDVFINPMKKKPTRISYEKIDLY